MLIALTAMWCFFSLVAWISLLGTRTLAKAPPPGDSQPRHRVSVIIAARDEASRIGDTVERVLLQRGIDLDLTVVDDRSTDGTPAILANLAEIHPRLGVIRVDALPKGWLGKPHACHLGARAAQGDWFLFTDADAWMSDDLVLNAVSAAIRDDAQHLALFPGEDNSSLPARASMAMIMAATAPIPALVNCDAPLVAAGIGAFNLVRAEAYRNAGGYERLGMEVLDDLKLGSILRKSGARSRLYDANRDLKVQWAADVRGLFQAVEKNMFALFGFRALPALLYVVLTLAMWGATLLAPLWGSASGSLAFAPLAGMATVWIPALIVARRGDLGVLAALLSPLSVPILLGMIGNSTLRTLRQGGIRWRETFYPLSDLRRGGPPGA